MNKTKILILFALSAVLFACGEQDTPGDEQGNFPPKLKSNFIVISPFDTLKAEFDTEIANISDLKDGENIVARYANRVTSLRPSNKTLNFVGTYDATPGRLPYFRPGFLDSIVFKNIENDNGIIQEKEVLRFYAHNIFDSPQNNSREEADNIDFFAEFLNTTVEDGVTFAGVLDSIPSPYDLEDYFTLRLRARDAIEIKAGNFRDPLLVQFFVPGGLDKTMNVKKGSANILKETITSDHLVPGDDISKVAQFYIRVYTNNSFSRPNPYTISVSVKKN